MDPVGTYPVETFQNAGVKPVGFADRPGLLATRVTVCVDCGTAGPCDCADC